MVKSSKISKSEQPTTPEFSEHVIGLIIKALPADTDPEQRRWLEEYLPDWAKHRLPIILRVREYELAGALSQQVLAVRKSALELREAIEAFDPVARRAIIVNLPPRPKELSPLWWATDEWVASGQPLLDQLIDLVSRLIDGVGRIKKHEGPGRRANIMPIILVGELAMIFESVTGKKARREIDRTADKNEPYETGPFHEFVFAFWPVIFRSDAGLPSALKKWASVFKEKSKAPR